MWQIAFDESGNTGQNLFDKDAPVFALASCCFDSKLVSEFGRFFSSVQAPELKFSKLVGRPRNERMILEFLRSPFINSETVKIDVTHKEFMVISKYVDVVLEPFFRQGNIDIYERGCNLATANLLTTVCPAMLPSPTWQQFLREFAALLWKPEIGNWARFISQADSIYNRLQITQNDLARFFFPAVQLKGQYKRFQSQLHQNELDPIIPAYTKLANSWGRQLKEPFVILADKSKVLASHIPTLLKLSAPNLRPATAGYNSRTMDFPLKVAQILPEDSKLQREIQFADLLAGASCYFLRNESHKIEGTFESSLKKVLFDKKLIAHVLWPSDDITPESLDALDLHEAETNLNDYTARILSGDPDVTQ